MKKLPGISVRNFEVRGDYEEILQRLIDKQVKIRQILSDQNKKTHLIFLAKKDRKASSYFEPYHQFIPNNYKKAVNNRENIFQRTFPTSKDEI